MASVRDVAQYIRDKMGGRLSTIKLQKLVYYAKAWSLAWDDDPLFSERLEAWANGPVSPDLYALHRGHFFCPETFDGADTSKLTDSRLVKGTTDAKLKIPASGGDNAPQRAECGSSPNHKQRSCPHVWNEGDQGSP
ncbi:MAG: DUF4065 domain-containing protein [Desulfovibrio sp.]|nr:DUF4065 domain-containing protein [Desulfovibrio sp.]